MNETKGMQGEKGKAKELFQYADDEDGMWLEF